MSQENSPKKPNKSAPTKPKPGPKPAETKAKAAKTAKSPTSGKVSGKATAKPAKKAKTGKPAAKSTSGQKPAPKTKTRKASAPKKQTPKHNSESKTQSTNKTTNDAHQNIKSNGQSSLIGDFDALSEYLTDITGRSQHVLQEFLSKNPEFTNKTSASASDPLNVGEAFQEVMKGLSQDPGTVLQRQFKLWGEYAKLMANTQRKISGETVKPTSAAPENDKRFKHKAWEENPMLDFVKQSYLIVSDWLDVTVDQLEGLDEHEHSKAKFYTKQFTDALAPSNFAMLNPEVLETTLETKGENLLKGFQNLLEDLDRGDGKLAITQADTDFFELGKNIATTPGKVIFQNEIFQLIQYEPTTPKVAKRPLLIFPPWINKFYILDLQEKNSFIRWMVDQGRTVFVVSWVNPGSDLKDKSFYDYIRDGAYVALDAIEQATSEREVDTIGYCIGGTMLSTALCHMAQTDDSRIKSATFFTAQADFTEAGDLLLFVDDPQLDALEKQMDAAGGVLEGRAMATTFNMLRSNDLIWSFVIDNYLKGKDPAKFDLLFWNSDATRMPKGVHLFYLRDFYQKNSLASGTMVMDGKTLNLADVNIPIFMQAGETDHIAPYRSIYNTAKLFGGDVEYMLAGSGHIAGVVNHPSRGKYHHRVNDALPDSVEEWMEKATHHQGSWWEHWMQWLDRVSPGKVPARIPGDGNLRAIEDAPGSYVRVKA